MARRNTPAQQPELPESAERTKAKLDELRSEVLRVTLNKTMRSKRTETGKTIVTAYATLVPEHRFRRAEAAALAGQEVVLCPTKKDKPEVHAEMKQANSHKVSAQKEPVTELTFVGGAQLDKLFDVDSTLDVYEVQS